VKIALVRHMMDEPQGGARLIALLARDLYELGEDVTLYCYRYDRERCFPELLRDVGVRCVRDVTGGRGSRRAYESGWRRARLQVRRYFLEARVLASTIDPATEIVNPHEWLAHRSAAILSRRRGIPVVWTYNDPSHWHVHHGRGISEIPYRLLGALDNRQVNRFAAVTTLSRWMTEVAKRSFTVPVHLVRCGIDGRVVRSPARHTDPVPGKPLVLLSVGVLAPQRRFEDAIEGIAVARARGCACQCTIVGTDRFAPAYGKMLRDLVARLDLKAAVTLRFESLSEEDLDQLYAEAQGVIFPNEQQAWGLAQLEAMAWGIPAIVSRGAGVSEVLRDGEHALLVDPRRPDQIGEAIVTLASSAAVRQRMGTAGRRLVLDSYTSRGYAERMRELFRSVAQGWRTRSSRIAG
jgi:glycosyltransferase involved in cell wall biosynthesis